MVGKALINWVFPDWKYWENEDQILLAEGISFRYSKRRDALQFTASGQGWMDLPEGDSMAKDCRLNIEKFE